jgi:hypothetical protein
VEYRGGTHMRSGICARLPLLPGGRLPFCV